MAAPRRILVVFESGPRGAAALAEGLALARQSGGAMTVLTLAPAQPVIRCGPCDDALDRAVIEAAEWELAQARELLARERSVAVAYETLAHADTRSLAAFITAGGFGAVVVSRRRLLAGGHIRVRAVERLVAAPLVVAGSVPAPPVGSTLPVG